MYLFSKEITMNNKDILRIIKEEVSDFDFLGNEERSKYVEEISTLKDEEFQKQFICDSLVNRNNNIKQTVGDSSIEGDWAGSSDNDKLNLDYSVNIEYRYDRTKEPIKFILSFFGDNVDYSVEDTYEPGTYQDEPQSDSWFEYIDWSDIEVQLETHGGDDIKFTALYNAPEKIQNIFIKEYILEFIQQATHMDVMNIEKNQGEVQSYC